VFDSDISFSLAQFVPCTEAEGPGKRFALWFQGCPLRCSGCCNPEFLKFEGGESWTVDRIMQEIAAVSDQIEGITLLGGEPFAHAKAAAAIASETQKLGLSVMVFSGFIREELESRPNPEIQQLLQQIDILIDGPYLKDQPDTTRRWIGSQNQRIHFLTSRYRAEDECWKQPNTLEIRFGPNGLEVNGFPSLPTVDFWKGKFTRKPLPAVSGASG
jgi:anaerobic ribonucleoside-triphosphate reductase activating protein